MQPQRWLVACHDIVLTGGLLRFDRLGRALRRHGHQVAFLTLSEAPRPERQTDLPVLRFHEAALAQWHATMIPGAGFPQETIKRLVELHAPNFGVRVQHVLNDQSRRERFLAVNRAFHPHLVVCNNAAWPPGSFLGFDAERFHVLAGAVDLETFRRDAAASGVRRGAEEWVIGGLATKNPQPLIDALDMLPPYVRLRLFGPAANLPSAHANLAAAGRLEFVGPLREAELPSFYRGVDCVVMTELSAGWSNLVAEAMASGKPVVCTPHGTSFIAFPEATALVMECPTAEAIAANVMRLLQKPALGDALATAALHVISSYSWGEYGRQLLALLPRDGHCHFTYAPELGLFGKKPLSERAGALRSILERAHGLSVVDFGAAEGAIAREFLLRGATVAHGFDIDPHRVRFAAKLCESWQNAAFRCADLSDSISFSRTHADLLLDGYDVVLYLGLHHHLPSASRLQTLDYAMSLAVRYFAVRTPDRIFADDHISSRMEAAGFHEISGLPTVEDESMSPLRIYERALAGSDTQGFSPRAKKILSR